MRPAVVARMALLQLKGERNAVVALRTAGGLLAAESALNAFELEVLGAVLTANGKAADAVRILERAREDAQTIGGVAALRSPLPTAPTIDSMTARQPWTERRASLNRSAREHADLIAAKQLFKRE